MQKSANPMEQHTPNVLIQEEKQKLNKLKREEVVPWYRFASLPYYQNNQENEKFEQIIQNFEPLIHCVIEQGGVIQGIRMSIRVELVLVTRQ